MKKLLGENKILIISSLFLALVLIFSTVQAEVKPAINSFNNTLRVGVVGDTGIGERAYSQGFNAVAKALKKHRPDLLLHLGDFVYQPKIFPPNSKSSFPEYKIISPLEK